MGFIQDWSRYNSGPCKALFHPGSGGFTASGFNISCSGVIYNSVLMTNAEATKNGVNGRIRYFVIGEI
ncbi:MAG: hypothetical protein ACRCYA_08395 [Cetobacterium sp.]|uniref:hypothetical protein n=1 Tax=Cetobacterium sp. TaxID=2071632 RepID=UPI003F38BE8D